MSADAADPLAMPLVLLVEDEQLIRDMLVEALDEAGFSSLVAADGREAFRLFEKNGDEIRALVTDINLDDGMDGIAWYRLSFDLGADEAARGVKLGLGAIDDADITWVNGIEVGRTNGYNLPRVYDVPSSALRAGRNVLAVRVEDTGGGGGIYDMPSAPFRAALAA